MTEVLGEEPVSKLESEIASALRRRPAHEAFLAGTLRELTPFSPRLRQVLARAVAVLVRRGSFQRLLYAAAVRALAEHAEEAVASQLISALGANEAGGLATLSAAGMTCARELGPALARAAANRHPHLAFGAEVARVARGESNGDYCAAVAPRIKESHRIALCTEVVLPLLWRPPLPQGASRGLSVLRQSERHIGRWLVLAEIGSRSGDFGAAKQARGLSQVGSASSRAAWALVCWALVGSSPPPAARPTLEVLARLSDRPAAERDVTFLFRMGEAHLASARSMLEAMVKGQGLSNETSIRAALLLGRRYARGDLTDRLIAAARCHKHEGLRGLAAAALFDLGRKDLALSFADELVNSKKLPTLGWAALIRAAGAGKLDELVTEARFRHVQRGWVE